MNVFQKMLLTCSGAVEDVICLVECHGDTTKYEMVGGFVLLTSAFAFFSGGFALYTGFQSVPLAAVIAILWAALIFNIDRFVISTARKSDVEGLPLLSRLRSQAGDWGIAAPRLLLAALISIVVAVPLEIRFFAPEIEVELASEHQADYDAARQTISAEFDDVKRLREDSARRLQQVDDARVTYQQANDLALRELDGTGGTAHKGDGPVYKQRKTVADQAKDVWRLIEKENAAAVAINDRQVEELLRSRDRKLIERQNKIQHGSGFAARYRALGHLSDANRDIRIARWFIMLLFFGIEVTPVLMKLLMTRGPYDDLLDSRLHQVHVDEKLRRSNMNDDVHAEVAIRSLKNAERIALEERLTREAYDFTTVSNVASAELEEAQRKIARASIDHWLRNQMKVFGAPRPQRISLRTP